MNAFSAAIQGKVRRRYTGHHTHIPESGYDHDLVLTLRHDRLHPFFAQRLDRWAHSDSIHKTRTFKLVSNLLVWSKRNVVDLNVEIIAALQNFVLEGVVEPHSFTPDVSNPIMKHFGHGGVALRRHGHADRLYGNAHIAGYNPKHLAYELIDNARVFREILSEAERMKLKVRWQDTYDGAWSNDDDLDISKCVILKLDRHQYNEAPHALRRVGAHRRYNSFALKTEGGEETDNCITMTWQRLLDELDIVVPKKFKEAIMPEDIDAAIEEEAVRQPSLKKGEGTIRYVSGAVMQEINSGMPPQKPWQAALRRPTGLLEPAVAAAGIVAKRVTRVAGFGLAAS